MKTTRHPPYVHCDYNTAPVKVFWNRLTPTGNPTFDWHWIMLPRYNKDSKLTQIPNPYGVQPYGRKYFKGKFAGIQTLSDVPEEYMRLPRIKKGRGQWSDPIFWQFTPSEIKQGETEFIATNTGAL